MRTPTFFRYLFPKQIWRLPKQANKTVYLTFDDGPIPDVTPWVLSVLKEHNIKATFFCIGDNIRKHPHLIAQITQEGHSVGNHTFHHLNGWKTPSDTYINNILQCEQEIEKHHPITKKIFRPPYGRITPKQVNRLKQLGYTIIMWDILSYDFDKNTSETACYNHVVKNVRTGSIIVFHDSLKAEKNLRHALPQVIDTLIERGYTFEKL